MAMACEAFHAPYGGGVLESCSSQMFAAIRFVPIRFGRVALGAWAGGKTTHKAWN